MHKVNEIQRKLQGIPPGTFQKLGDAYLKKKEYERINSLGSVIGSDKVRPGTPDSLIPLENGSYVFAEHTTINQKKLLSKIEQDLDKCLNEQKTGVPLDKIEEIIFCHTGKLQTKEFEHLIERCQKKGINLNIYGIDEISNDLFANYKGLAKEFLSIEVDTGQILFPEEFVSAYGKNELTTPLDTSFQYREDEITDLVKKIKNENLIILTGKAGVGKTRLALEGCKRFTEEYSSYKVICIYNRFQQDLAEEVRVLLSEPGNFLILVDDANRISRFDYFIPYLQDQNDEKKIKVIATVRDYAENQIMKIAQQYGSFGHLKIDPLTDKQIKGLVRKEFGIKNPSYLERIQDISQGNPRLALMAGKIADKYQTLNSIRDVSNLYEEYYKNIDADLNRLGSTNLLKVAGIIAFYRAVDRSNEEQTNTIKDVFEINPDSFWQAAKDLHSIELLDMYETEVVRISDQVLGTYLFYKAIFEDEVIQFSTLLNNFFPDYRQRFIDAIIPVINAFDDQKLKEMMRPDIENAFSFAKESNDETKLMHLMNTFWFIKPIEILAILGNKIKEVQEVSIDITEISFEPSELSRNPSILKILGQFEGSELDNFRLSVQLILKYAAKRPDKIPQVIKLFNEQIGFHRYSWRYDYIHQEIIIDELWKKAQRDNNNLFSKLFLTVSNHYLKTRFRDYRPKGSNTISIIEFELNPSDKLLQVRGQMWKRIFKLFQNPTLQMDVLEILQEYSNAGYLVSKQKIIKYDATHIFEFIESELSPDNLRHCLFIKDYSGFLNQKGIKAPDFIDQYFKSDTYKLAKLLLTDRFERIDSELSTKEYAKKKNLKLAEHIADYSFDNFMELLDQCHTIFSALSYSHKKFQLRQSLVLTFRTIANSDKKLYLKVFTYFLKLEDPFDLNILSMSNTLLDCCSISEAMELVEKESPDKQNAWLFGILHEVPKRQVTKQHLDLLYKLYKNTDRTEMPNHMNYLLKYLHLDSKVVPNVVRILLDRAKDDSSFIYIFTIIFNPHTDINKSIIEFFEDDLHVLKMAYIAAIDSDRHTDYDSTTLIKIFNHDQDFILEYIDRKFNQEEHFSPIDENAYFAFIWLQENFMELMGRISHHIFDWEKEKPAISKTYFLNFYALKEDEENKGDIEKRQDAFLTQEIERHYDQNEYMQFLFSVVCNLGTERRKKIIALFLQYNNDFEDFELLPLEPSQWGWTGSAVPMYQERIDFLSSLLPLLNSVEFLKHRHLIKKKIERLRKTIKAEQKNDFLREY